MFWTWFFGLSVVIGGALLVAGFLTSIISPLIFAVGLLSVVFPAAMVQNASDLLEIYLVVLAAAIFLLGPGAFSLDARLFGRREIIIPKNPAADNP